MSRATLVFKPEFQQTLTLNPRTTYFPKIRQKFSNVLKFNKKKKSPAVTFNETLGSHGPNIVGVASLEFQR